MIKLLGKIPRKVWVAFSGGIDSVVAADFLLRGNKEVNLVFVNHGTVTSKVAEIFAKKFAEKNLCKLHIHNISGVKEKDQSQEEFWRQERYLAFQEYPAVITAHHLNDAVETWLWRSLNGKSRTIQYRNNNVIRPFLLNKKEVLYDWARRHQLEWIEDISNLDTKYTRNKIRHELLPKALEVQPGLFKVVKKQILADFEHTKGTKP